MAKVVLDLAKVVLDMAKAVLDEEMAVLVAVAWPLYFHYFVSRDDVLHTLRCEHGFMNCLYTNRPFKIITSSSSSSNCSGPANGSNMAGSKPMSSLSNHWCASDRLKKRVCGIIVTHVPNGSYF